MTTHWWYRSRTLTHQDDFVCAFEEERENPVAVTYVQTMGGIGLRAEASYAVEAWENLKVLFGRAHDNPRLRR